MNSTQSVNPTLREPLHTVELTGIDRAGKTASPATHHFKHAGRQWRLFKRSPSPDAYWQILFQRKGDVPPRKLCSLKTSSVKHAQIEAVILINNWLQRRRDERSGLAPKAIAVAPTSTLGELFRVVESLDMEASRKSRQSYVWAARKFFAFALDLPDVAGQPLTRVNGETAQRFWTKAIAAALALPDQTAQNKFKRQARGWFNNTKALFAPDAVRSMPALGIHPPAADALAAFRASKPKQRFKVHKAGEFIAPDTAIKRATFRAWIALGAIQRRPEYAVRGGSGRSTRRGDLEPLNPTARRNMFLAIGLMLAGGLRKQEVTQIRWQHLTRDAHGIPRLDARDVRVKKGTGEISVKPLDPFWRILQRTAERNAWRGQPDDYVLAERPKTAGDHGRLVFSHGGKSDRTYWPFYHVGKWLRALGWNLQKTNHALRDLAASYVTMKFGLDRAKIFCRHSTRATTESHYQKFVNEDLMDNPNRLAWLRWAK